MNAQGVWNALVKVQTHLEKARGHLEGIDPVSLSIGRGNRDADRLADQIVRHVTSTERDLNRARTEVREACFRLADRVTIRVEQDPDYDPSDDIEP